MIYKLFQFSHYKGRNLFCETGHSVCAYFFVAMLGQCCSVYHFIDQDVINGGGPPAFRMVVAACCSSMMTRETTIGPTQALAMAAAEV